MVKRILLSLIFLVVIITFLFTAFKLTFSQYIADEKTHLLYREGADVSEDDSYNLKWIASHNDSEEVKGWINGNILFNYEESDEFYDAVYFYNPQKGEKELISIYGDYRSVDSLISAAGENTLLHYKYGSSGLELFNFIDAKSTNEDFEYDVISKNSDIYNKIKLYDLKTGSFKDIFEYKQKARILKEANNSAIDNFQDVGWSNNGDFIGYCIEEDIGNFKFSIFDVNKETTREYRTTKENSPFDFVYNLNISNDGNSIWIRTAHLGDNHNKQELLKYVLDEGLMTPELIAEDVNVFKVSHDNKTILYTKYENKYEPYKNMLVNLNLSTGEENVIAKDVIDFDLSFYDNRVVYLTKYNQGAKLFIRGFENDSTESKYIYTFQALSGVECIRFGDKGRSLLVSFYINNKKLSLRQYKTCVIGLK